MKRMHYRTFVTLLLLSALMLGAMSGTGHPALAAQASQAITISIPEFQSLWVRTDLLVATGHVKRSFYWGPAPISDTIMEHAANVPGGQHTVQYFDKSRMEVNDLGGDKNNPFYVTNGLLTRELITGWMDSGVKQQGNNTLVYRWPAYIPLGDNTGTQDEITYASFRAALDLPSTAKVGSSVRSEMNSYGPLSLFFPGTLPVIGTNYNVLYAYYENVTRQGIPDVFWNFLNATGPVLNNGDVVTRRLSDPYFYASGYPITDAYWAKLTVEGKRVDALIQVFERRILTYVPSAPEGFKVQMGNVGRHYYDWRYKDAGKPPALAGTCPGTPVAGFGKVYAENQNVRLQLGCRFGIEAPATIERQTFQKGQMIGVPQVESYSNRLREDVFVLFDGGAAQTFQIYGGYVNGPLPTPTPVPSPPTPDTEGLYTPQGAFAEVWQSSGMSAKLGKATAPPDVQAKSANGSRGGVLEYFEGGLMVYPDLAVRQIYVLYNRAGYAYVQFDPINRLTPKTNVDNWAVYNDTFAP